MASSGPTGTSNPAFASARAFFARVIRAAIVGVGTRNARATCSVDRPPTSLSVSATRPSRVSTGWQAVKISLSTSSVTWVSNSISSIGFSVSVSSRAWTSSSAAFRSKVTARLTVST